MSFLAANVAALQQKALGKCLLQIDDSDLAKTFNLKPGLGIHEYQSQVPLMPYANIERFVNRVARGEHRAMFNARATVNMFALTSGTTGSRKMIPVTQAQTESLRRSWYWWGVGFYRDHPHLLKAPVVHLTSSWFHEKTDAGFPIGDLSGYMAHILPWYVRMSYLLPESVSDIEHQKVKYYTYLRLLLANKNIQFISTATPATLVSLADWAHEWRHELLRDLRDGTFKYRDMLSAKHWQSLKPWMKGCPKDQLRYLMALGEHPAEKFWPRVFWPRLTTLATWTGGTMSHFKDALERRYAVTSFRDIGYVASEGHMTMPLLPGIDAGVPNLEEYFFEFIAGDGSVKLLHQLEAGRDYSVVVTTQSGLIRHQMHDIVTCAGLHAGLPLLRFLRKEQHVSDISGEKLSAFHVVNALSKVQRKFGFEAHQGAIAPQGNGYCLFVEANVFSADVELLEEMLDQSLRSENFIYAEHRDVEKIIKPKVLILNATTFERLKERRLSRLHAPMEQYKHPCLLTNKDDIAFLEKNVKVS